MMPAERARFEPTVHAVTSRNPKQARLRRLYLRTQSVAVGSAVLSPSTERSVTSFQWSKARFAMKGFAMKTSPRGSCPAPASSTVAMGDRCGGKVAVAASAAMLRPGSVALEPDLWTGVVSCDTTRSVADNAAVEDRGWP